MLQLKEFSAIKLTEGTFYVGPLYAQGFKGAVQGKTKAFTVLVAVDESFACSEASGTYAAMFNFTLGEPQIKSLTLQASQPCQTTGEGPDTTRFAFIHFNSDTSNCNRRTMFLDRLNIVAEFASPAYSPTRRVTGKVLVNRSEFSAAVQTKVDISFNTFLCYPAPVVISR